MTVYESCDKTKVLPYERGMVYCPSCRRRGNPKHRLLRVRYDTIAHRLPVYCRACKREYIINIEI